MRDITYCYGYDCPSEKCPIRVTNNKFEPHELISIADFRGECRYYIGWVVRGLEE